MYAKTCVALALLGIAAGEANPRPTPAPTARAEESQVTAITDCHLHETDLFCFAGDAEYHVQTTVPTATEDLPAQFTDCHSHGEDFFCVDADGEDVMAINESGGEEAGEDEHNHSEEEGAAEENQHCHFHAGVEYGLISKE